MKIKLNSLLSIIPVSLLPISIISCSNSAKPKEPIIKETEKTKDPVEKIINFKTSSTSAAIINAPLKVKNSIRIGSWNLLNFTGKDTSHTLQSKKTEAFTSVIKNQKLDVIALNEISNDNKDSQGNVIALKALLDKLQKIDPNSQWKGFISPELFGKDTGQLGQKEHIIYLYRSSILVFNTLVNNAVYENEFWDGHFEKTKRYNFARPPFGAKFSTKGPIINDFTIVAFHADSPGKHAKREEKTIQGFSGQGAQEVEEAYKIAQVMAWYDQKNGVDDELIFLGDTNIRTGNQAKAFASLIEAGYKSLFPDTSRYATTLSGSGGPKFGRYANTYDKIFYKGGLTITNPSIWDLWSIKTNDLFDFKSFSENRDKERGKKYQSAYNYFVNLVSDHTLVYFDLNLDKNDKT